VLLFICLFVCLFCCLFVVCLLIVVAWYFHDRGRMSLTVEAIAYTPHAANHLNVPPTHIIQHARAAVRASGTNGPTGDFVQHGMYCLAVTNEFAATVVPQRNAM
jgi:ABC-type uncharacterized transport system permease subunit